LTHKLKGSIEVGDESYFEEKPQNNIRNI